MKACMLGLWLIMLSELLEPNQHKQLVSLNSVVLQLRFDSGYCHGLQLYLLQTISH